MFFNKFKKIITTVLIISFIIPSVFSFRPQKAESAITVMEIGANLYANTEVFFKEHFLDTLAWLTKEVIIRNIVASTVAWINSGFEGSPSFLTNFEDFMRTAGDAVLEKYLEGTGLDFVCSPFSVGIKVALKQDFRGAYEPKCTIEGIGNNVENAFLDVDNWLTITQGQGANSFSTYFETKAIINADIQAEKEKEILELNWGEGFLSYEDCETIDVCDDRGCRTEEKCTNTTPGNAIADTLNQHLHIGEQMLVEADEINEILSALLAQLAKMALTGVGGVLGLSDSGSGSGGSSYLGDLADDNTHLSDPTERVIDEIEKDIASEQEYLDIKTGTLEILEKMKRDLYTLINKCDAPEVEAWVNGVIQNQIDPLIEQIQADIDESQDLIDQLNQIINDLRNLSSGGGGGVDQNPNPTTGDFSCNRVFGPSNTNGYFSLASFGSQLLAGAFGYGHFEESMLFGRYGRVNPGLTGISESVCVMREFNGYLYANTEANGFVYRSPDGLRWKRVHAMTDTIGCGMTVHKDKIYVSGANYVQGSRKGSIYRSSDGINWQKVLQNNVYIRDLVSYDGKIYAFGVDNGGGGVILSSVNGANWQSISTEDRYFRGTVIGDTLWAGLSAKYSASDTSGIAKYDGNNFTKVYSSSAYDHITYVKEWNNNLFVGTTKGFKVKRTGGNAVGPTNLLYSSDDGSTWKVACSVPEVGIWDLVVHNGRLYFATLDYNNNSNGYVYEVRNK